MQRASATRRISKATSEAEYISGHEKKRRQLPVAGRLKNNLHYRKMILDLTAIPTFSMQRSRGGASLVLFSASLQTSRDCEYLPARPEVQLPLRASTQDGQVRREIRGPSEAKPTVRAALLRQEIHRFSAKARSGARMYQRREQESRRRRALP
jgi:hypothetical protein